MTVAPRGRRERCPSTGGPAPAEEPALGRPRGDWSGAEPDRRRSGHSCPRRCAGHACPGRTGQPNPGVPDPLVGVPSHSRPLAVRRRVDAGPTPSTSVTVPGRTGRGSPCRRAGQISLGPPLSHPHAAPSTLPRRQWPALRRRQLRHRPTPAGSAPTGRIAGSTDLDRRAAPMRGWISFGAMVRLVSGTFNIIGGLVAASATQGYAGDIGVIFGISPSGAGPGCSMDVAWIINGQASLERLINRR